MVDVFMPEWGDVMGFPKDVVENALVACGRSCCICHKFCGVHIETHHMKPKQQGGEDTLENCIPLCFDCHAAVEHYNEKHPRGRKFTEGELRKHRDNWYKMVQELNTPRTSSEKQSPSVTQIVNGRNNVVAGRDVNIQTEKIVTRNVVHTDPGGKHISNSTALKLLDLLKEYLDFHIAAGKDPKKEAQKIWRKLQHEFKVTSYKEISFDRSEELIRWIQAQIAMARPKIRRKDPDLWKQSLFKPIYSRAGELGMSKPQVYAFAQERLALKKPITSLKDLTQQNLMRLHNIMIAEVRKHRG